MYKVKAYLSQRHLRAIMFGHFCGHLGPSIVCLSSVTRLSKKLHNPRDIKTKSEQSILYHEHRSIRNVQI